jgi:hypothetical protein
VPISLRTKTVFHCKCVHPDCAYEWDASKKPKRCAGCKRHTWNGEDQRTQDPFNKVPIISQIETGTKAPVAPDSGAILGTFIKARRVISTLIGKNGHRSGNAVLADIDQQIEELKKLQPRRSTYLVQRD